MTVTGIAFIMYPVTDVKRAVAFYEDVFGFQKSGIDQPYWVEFDVAGTTVGVGNFEPAGKPGTAQSLSLEIDDMTAFRARLKERDLESMEPHETPVCFISMVKDPDGNQVWLHQAKPS